VQGQFDEQNGVFSPDGRWVAYSSNESATDEIYAQRRLMPDGSELIEFICHENQQFMKEVEID
jgi:Tol biopolymer transport system component